MKTQGHRKCTHYCALWSCLVVLLSFQCQYYTLISYNGQSILWINVIVGNYMPEELRYTPSQKIYDRHAKSSCKRTFKTRIRKNATAPENPIWIMVSVIGNGKLKYFGESTHCTWAEIEDNLRVTKTNLLKRATMYCTWRYITVKELFHKFWRQIWKPYIGRQKFY